MFNFLCTNFMELVFPLHFISWKKKKNWFCNISSSINSQFQDSGADEVLNTKSDISRKCILPNIIIRAVTAPIIFGKMHSVTFYFMKRFWRMLWHHIARVNSHQRLQSLYWSIHTKDESNTEPCLLSSWVWIDSGVVVSQHC